MSQILWLTYLSKPENQYLSKLKFNQFRYFLRIRRQQSQSIDKMKVVDQSHLEMEKCHRSHLHPSCMQAYYTRHHMFHQPFWPKYISLNSNSKSSRRYLPPDGDRLKQPKLAKYLDKRNFVVVHVTLANKLEIPFLGSKNLSYKLALWKQYHHWNKWIFHWNIYYQGWVHLTSISKCFSTCRICLK